MRRIRQRNHNSTFMAVLMNILMPGLGHIYWKEFLFGMFIFMVVLIASVLFVVGLFIHIPLLAKVILYSLPILFYFFSFVDLIRTVHNKTGKLHRSKRTWLIFLGVGVIYQLLWPLAPVNFGLRNAPEVFVQKNSDLNPLYHKGDLLKASRLAYFLNIYILDRPLVHALPERYDLVRFEMSPGDNRCGVVVGLPGEEIEISGGVLVIDNVPKLASTPDWLNLSGDWPLTSVEGYSMLVVTMRLGSVDKMYEIPLTKIKGKVGKLF